MRRIEFWMLAIALVGCSGDKTDTTDTTGGDADTDADADADTDADTDADSDADTDADTDVPKDSIAGTITWNVQTDGAVDCDESITLTGDEYLGGCPGCTFAFKVSGAVATQTGAGCGLGENYTFVEDDVPYQSFRYLAYAPSYGPIGTYYGGSITYENALLAGYVLDGTLYGGSVYGPYFTAIYSSNYPANPNIIQTNTLTYGSNAIDFHIAAAYDSPIFTYTYSGYFTSDISDASSVLNSDTTACPAFDETAPQFDDAFPLVVGTASLQDDVDCHTFTSDVVVMDLVAGDVVDFSVDTVDAGTAFDPIAWVNGPDGCTLHAPSDENVDCTFAPVSGYTCPAGQFTADVDGTYEIVIAAFAFTAAGSACDPGVAQGGYDLQVSSPNVTTLTLQGDDVPFWDATSHITFDYHMANTITPN